MSRNGKHLGHVGGVRVPELKVVPTSVSDKPLTLESNLCQCRFGCAKAGVLHFLSRLPSVFPSCSCSSVLVLMCCGEPPWNGRGNAATHHERQAQKSDLRKFQR